MVSDLNNCLVWLKASDCAGNASWVGAHTRASNLFDGSTAFSGSDCNLTDGSTQGDWRLPTRHELVALVNGPERVRAVTPGPFTGVVSTDVWSSTSNATDASDAWFVFRPGGSVRSGGKSRPLGVWRGRGGQ